jgi:hypothetical protein
MIGVFWEPLDAVKFLTAFFGCVANLRSWSFAQRR